jgi:hypothetical protein
MLVEIDPEENSGSAQNPVEIAAVIEHHSSTSGDAVNPADTKLDV